MNTTEKKNHYRNVFKSDHLGSSDLEDMIEQGKSLILIVREVKQEFGAKVAGKKGDFNIAYFDGGIKPLVLNATNSKQIKLFVGTPFVEEWKNVPIELYIDDNVKQVGGGFGNGVRIRPIQPRVGEVAKPIFTTENFEKAKTANATKQQIQSRYQLPNDTWLQYEIYASIPTA